MRPKLVRLFAAVILLAGLAALASKVHAQASNGPYLGPYSVYNSNLTALRPQFVAQPVLTNIRVQTSVTVPDGGTALLGGYSRLSEGRNEFGVPGLGSVPYVGRGVRNAGYGREAVAGRVTATVRVINLYEEEERQTGVRRGR